MSDGALSAKTARSGRWLSPSRTALRMAGLGLATGAMGGMATFVWTRSSVMPPAYPSWLPVALMVAAGAYTYLFAPTLRASVIAFGVSLPTALAVAALGWVAPLWLLSYPPAARDLLVPQYLQAATIEFVFTYFAAFSLGYLVVVSLDGMTDW